MSPTSSNNNGETISKKRTHLCTYKDCHKSYTTSTHLRRHQQIHIGHIKCTVKSCRKKFKSTVYLKKHMHNLHNNKQVKRYKCSQCGEEFNNHNWFLRHQFYHTGVKPYFCPEDGCKMRFLVPSKLKRHMKIHAGYNCTEENCGQTFSKWAQYDSHMSRSHSSIKICYFCDKTFSVARNLKAHMEIHKSDREVFSCPKPNCGRFYTMKRNLDHHIRFYHDARPFVCPQEHCHKAYKTEADMKMHFSHHTKLKCREHDIGSQHHPL